MGVPPQRKSRLRLCKHHKSSEHCILMDMLTTRKEAKSLPYQTHFLDSKKTIKIAFAAGALRRTPLGELTALLLPASSVHHWTIDIYHYRLHLHQQIKTDHTLPSACPGLLLALLLVGPLYLLTHPGQELQSLHISPGADWPARKPGDFPVGSCFRKFIGPPDG